MSGFNIFNYDVKTNYTEQLSDFLTNLRYEDLPKDVIDRAKCTTLHAIGCSIAAADMDMTKSANKIAAEVGKGGNATSWTNGQKLTPAAACFANGTACDMLDWEDCSYTGHPMAALVPAAMAVAEDQKATGKDYLTAFVAGFEVYQRIALCVGHPAKGRPVKFGHALPNWPVFAASMAAAKFYGLDAEKTNQAIGMSVLFHKQLSNLQQATLSGAYHYESGWCAQGGLQAALCAREGINNLKDSLDIPYAYVEQQIEDPPYEWLNKELGSRWLLMELLVKHWPANMWVQNPVEAALSLLKQHQFALEDIEEIIVNPPLEFRMHFRPEGYESLMDAEFSTPYCIAAALYNPDPGPEWYSAETMKDPKVLALAAKVKSGDAAPDGLLYMFNIFLESNGKAFPKRTVTIRMKDGTVYEEMVELPKGHPANMLTHDEFHELFLHQTSKTLPKEKAEGLFNFIMDLENQEDLSKIGQFFVQ